ncbi:hypothetical protein phiAS5_ORF0199 [Aeromonas phage phiAS5]|uniref:Uncharacterized protein n=1 Tax=Aeromonas phage phiAS5 TaxID=879630 RepID=E1A2U6_9CAUD|nr:hypothetical protein phiAS5_ORF0199 [Aeromonas phage phiAS5]ADM80042.1 hypothetical protein phiAS5_ORF0199 [Aeromonas phage phiAS5]BES53189.1 hypothetical protein [Aeromonas phage phiWae14]
MRSLFEIRDGIIKRRRDELAKELKSAGYTFEKYRDCIVLEIGHLIYWIFPKPTYYSIEMKFTVEFTCRRKSSVLKYLRMLSDIDKDL